MKDIKIYFCDYWPTYDCYNDLIYVLLSKNYNVTVVDSVDKNTDLIVYSCFGYEHFKYNGVKKLYISGENDYPNFNQCDYAITHTVFENERHIRVPLWVFHLYREHKGEFVQHPNLDNSYFNRKFCGDVISNIANATPIREKIIEGIGSLYKKLDHGGKLLNNVGGPVDDKIKFLSNYKFSIAAENSIVDGYTTEKIYDSFMANTVPIYFGSPTVENDFNKDAFINVKDYSSFNLLVDRIKEIDNNEELYMSMLNASRMRTDTLYDDYCKKIEDFLSFIIDNGKVYNHRYGRTGYMNQNQMFY